MTRAPNPNPKRMVLGIMSGTSLDGVDYALCAVETDRVELQRWWRVPFPRPLWRALSQAATDQLTSYATAALHHELGRFYARHAVPDGSPLRIDLVGLHGQTIYHQPAVAAPATCQLGEPAYLAAALGVPVINNFRALDLAVGGQGAPLAPLFHRVVFGQPKRHVCVNNLGGISNVTSIDWRRGRAPKVIGFDTGPGNMLIDLAMRHFSGGQQNYDRNGQCAAAGKVCQPLVHRWLRHPFLRLPPPKSTGREVFGEIFWHRAQADVARFSLAPPDVLATLTEFTAASMVENYRRFLGLPDRVILTGGGASNPTLTERISRRLKALNPKVTIQDGASVGWPNQTIEPAAFAFLAWQRWHRFSGNIPAVTGARRALLLGQITEA
jgi:anhydro-N-acetylmuramic acid kinase